MDKIILSDEEKELAKRHKDFWNHNLKKPIINYYSLWRRINHLINLSGDILHPDWTVLGDGTKIEPGMLSPKRHHCYYEYNEFKDSRICGQVFNTIIPWTMITWLPAIAGCNLAVSVKGQTIWPQHYIAGDWYLKDSLGLVPNWQWLDKLKEFTSFLVEKYFPQRFVSIEMFSRGPGDLLINTLGPEQAYFAMHDRPDELKELLLLLADIHIKWSYEQLELILTVNGGYCNQWGIWAPGKVTRIQEDFAVNISEKHFKEFLAPAEMKIIAASEYQVFHTHSGIPEYAQWVSELEGLKVVEVTMDPVSAPIEDLIPLWNRILKKKSLIISGTFTESQIELLVCRLDNSGLFLDVEVKN